MSREQFEAALGKQFTDEDVVAGAAPYKVGDGLSYLHDSQENAYVIRDYPYGRQLRTLMRVWYEHDPKKGTRTVNQTQDPKNGRWNNPKKSTYSTAVVQVFDADGRLKPEGWSDAYGHSEAQAFYDKHKDNVPVWVVKRLVFIAAYYVSMEESKLAARNDGIELDYNRDPKSPYMIAVAKGMRAGKQALLDLGLIEKKEAE